MKCEITHRGSGAVLFSIESSSMRLALEMAVKGSANLVGANLRSADLRSANLWGANLRSADLGGADLRGADLRGADLWDANLRIADLRSANLVGANLLGADLGDANLGGADLRGADLRGTTAYTASRSDGYVFLASPGEGGPWLCAGCHRFTFAQARQHWTATRAGTPLGEESLALVDHLERMAKIAGWL